MTRISSLLFVSFFIVLFVTNTSFAAAPAPEEDKEWNYSNEVISYQVEKKGGSVYLYLDLNPELYQEIRIERSDNPVNYFRTVKYLGPDEVAKLSDATTVVDSYPLPGNIHSYYKVITVDQVGVLKMYPCVKLDKRGN